MRCTQESPLWYDCADNPCAFCPDAPCPDCLRYGDQCECDPYEPDDEDDFYREEQA